MAQARPVTAASFELAEGVIWDDVRAEALWVDILGGAIHIASWDGDRLTPRRRILLGGTVGAVALAVDGGYLAVGARGLLAIAPDGAVTAGPDLLGDRRDARLNDGSVDPQGRYLVGSRSLIQPTGTEVLLRVSADGTVETVRTGLTLSNGIGWSPDGATAYHVDTLTDSVASHSYAADAFDLDEPWVSVPVELAGRPDGLIVDSDGMLWVAQWGAGAVHRYDPAGALLETVSVDAPQVTCMGFVGPELDTLLITTAREGLTGTTDGSGALFAATVAATGLPQSRWAGSTISPDWAR